MRPRPRSAWRAVGLSAGGLCLALLLLESLLQVLAGIAWARGRGTPTGPAPKGERVVLCEGDSFTYGLGSSSMEQSYPAQLERLLRETGESDWTVLNRGRAGQNSRDILLRIDRDFEEVHPRLVYVLAGGNDLWSEPPHEVLPPPQGPPRADSFPWRWRTLRLARLLAHRLRSKPDPPTPEREASPPTFAGGWYSGRTRVEFRPDGRLSTGSLEARWSIEGDRMAIEGLPGAPLRPYWLLDSNRLLLHGGGLVGSVLLSRVPAGSGEGKGEAASSPDLVPHAWRAFESERFGEALRLYEARLRDSPEDLWARAGIVLTLQRLGHTREARDHVAWLQERARADSNRVVREITASSLSAIGERDACMRLAREIVEEHPDSATAWSVLAGQAPQVGDYRLARTAAEKALALTPSGAAGQRAFLHRVRSQALRAEEPKEALKSACEAFLEDRSELSLLEQFRGGREVFSRPMLEGCLDELRVGGGDRRRIEAVFARAIGPVEGREEILASHLKQIVERCRARGGQVVLVGYPLPNPVVDRAAQRAASEAGAGWLSVSEEFNRLLRSTSRDDLFIPDGHCTDRGYGVIARRVAEDARRRLP
ncbi:MAG: GDSL-type esterase/lipase family protein [Planctomycetes bacterium]|nr:GDSL-type esterase/lipase family protein [Planctomycetota bacterium]